MIHFLDDYIPACRLIISQIDTNRDLLFYAHSTIITEDVAASAHYEWRRNHSLMFKEKFLIRLDIRLLEILRIHDPRLGHKRQIENQVMFFFRNLVFLGLCLLFRQIIKLLCIYIYYWKYQYHLCFIKKSPIHASTLSLYIWYDSFDDGRDILFGDLSLISL